MGTLLCCFSFSNVCTLSRGKNRSISLLETRVTPDPGHICPVPNQHPWETQSQHLPRLWEASPFRPALGENDSIGKAAWHKGLKSKCLAALEVLELGQASVINKGALLAIVLKSMKSLQTQELGAPRGRPQCCEPLCPRRAPSSHRQALF